MDRLWARLEQLAREQRGAVASGDVESLCRIADLLPHAVKELQRSGFQAAGGRATDLEAMRATLRESERFLQDRMEHVRRRLRAGAAGARLARGYGASGRQSRTLDRSG